MAFGYHDALAYGGIEEAHPGGFSLTKKLLKNEKIKLGAKVLDAGCGMGLTSAYLAKVMKCKVYAIDLHPEMIKHAAKRFKKEQLSVEIIEGNIENLPFPEHSFDWVISESSTIFTNIPTTLKEYFRVLKPAGKLLSIEMTSEGTLQKGEEAKIKKFYNINIIPTEKEWVAAFRKSGFAKVDILKSNTILQELEEYHLNFDEQTDFPEEKRVDSAIEEILHEHSGLVMNYAEKLGYRVFKAVKN